MAGKRSYDDGCAAAHALDLIGERWALLVVRELMLGPKRFTELRADLRTISPNVLTQRLEDLEAGEILRRRRLPPPAASWVYELTPWGRELEPVLSALGRWAARGPCLSQGAPMSVAALMLSLRTMFDPARAEGFRLRLRLRLGESGYRVHVGEGALSVDPDDGAQTDVEAQVDADTLDALIYGGLGLDEAQRRGSVTVSGDAAGFARFLQLFPLPEAAAR